MKGSLVVVAFFCAGCMIGAVNNFQYDMHSVSMYVLYALMLQVGISIGSNKKLKELIKSLRLKMLLVPDVYKRQKLNSPLIVCFKAEAATANSRAAP